MRQFAHWRTRSQGFRPCSPTPPAHPHRGCRQLDPSPGGQALTSGPGRPLLTSHVWHPSFIPQPGNSVPAPIHGRCSPPKGAPRLGVSLTVKNRLDSQPQATWASPRTCQRRTLPGSIRSAKRRPRRSTPCSSFNPKGNN